MASAKEQASAHETIETIAALIANPRSHAFQKHHLKEDEFNNPDLGPPLGINGFFSFKQHVMTVLTSPEARTVHTRGTSIYTYHPPSQTVVILNVYGRMKKDGGTAFRLNAKQGQARAGWYQRFVALEAERMGVAGFAEQRRSLLEVLEKDTALADKFSERYTALHTARAAERNDEIRRDFRENAETVFGPRRMKVKNHALRTAG